MYVSEVRFSPMCPLGVELGLICLRFRVLDSAVSSFEPLITGFVALVVTLSGVCPSVHHLTDRWHGEISGKRRRFIPTQDNSATDRIFARRDFLQTTTTIMADTRLQLPVQSAYQDLSLAW